MPSVLLCAMAGYAFARYEFKGRNVLFMMVKPTMITMFILGVNAAWNDLMWPLLVTGSTKMRTLANGLALFIGSDTTEYGPAFAGAFISIAPMLVLYIFGQKYFIEGTMAGSVKG